jgi:SIR2-like domain
MTFSSTLVFVGAGASAPFGVPTMKAMVGKLQDRSSLVRGAERNLLERLVPRVSEYSNSHFDLEKLLDVIHDLGEGKSARESLARLAPHGVYRYRDTLERVAGGSAALAERASDEAALGDAQTARGLEIQITDQIADWCEHADFSAASRAYSELFLQIGQGQVEEALGQHRELDWAETDGNSYVPTMSLVTTNYDECLERSLSRFGAAPSMGFYFDEISRSREFSVRPEPRRTPLPTRPMTPGSSDRGELVLLKVHGSTNWWRTSDSRVVEVSNGARGQELADGATLSTREMRYPVATKDLVGMPYTPLYSWFATALAFAKTWIFVGYSFGDPSVVRMMSELWGSQKQVVVIGRHATEIVEGTFKGTWRANITPVNAEFRDPLTGAHNWAGEITEARKMMKAVPSGGETP